jgi:hypothetical protein
MLWQRLTSIDFLVSKNSADFCLCIGLGCSETVEKKQTMSREFWNSRKVVDFSRMFESNMSKTPVNHSVDDFFLLLLTQFTDTHKTSFEFFSTFHSTAASNLLLETIV